MADIYGDLLQCCVIILGSMQYKMRYKIELILKACNWNGNYWPSIPIWRKWMLKQTSRTCISNYIPHYLWDVILGSMVSHQRVIVGLSQSAPAGGWESPLHAWLASVNRIGGARCLNRRYRYGARGMHYHILLNSGNTAKTVTLTAVCWKILIAFATKMHVSKFQLRIPNGCCITKA